MSWLRYRSRLCRPCRPAGLAGQEKRSYTPAIYRSATWSTPPQLTYPLASFDPEYSALIHHFHLYTCASHHTYSLGNIARRAASCLLPLNARNSSNGSRGGLQPLPTSTHQTKYSSFYISPTSINVSLQLGISTVQGTTISRGLGPWRWML